MSIGKKEEPTEVAALLLPTQSPDATSPKAEADSENHKLLGIAYVAASGLCFSLMFTFIKYEEGTFSFMEAIFWRSFGALTLNYALVKYNGHSLYVPPDQRLMLALRCLAGFAALGFNFFAMSKMVLADASAIFSSSPIWTFFFGAFFLHEKIDPVSLVASFVAFGGLLCVVRPGFLFGYDHATAATDGSWIAVCSALLAAISVVFVYITVRKMKGLQWYLIVHYFALSSITLAMIWLAVIQQSFYVPDSFLLWRAIIGCGICVFGGQVFLTKGFQLEKAGIAAFMRYLDVVWVFIFDALFLGERINHWSVVGAAIILSGAVTIAVRKMSS